MTWRRNDLEAVPPRHISGYGEKDIKSLVKKGWPKTLNQGIHTTSDRGTAESYAISAANQTDSYPVVYTIDVYGLNPLPDGDAIFWWYPAGKKRAKEIVEETQLWMSPAVMSRRLAREKYMDPEKYAMRQTGKPLLKRGLAGDINAISEILVNVYDQKRYLTDIDLNRISRIEASSLKKRKSRFSTSVKATSWKTIYTGARAKKPEYHGSSVALLKQSFPEIDWP
jgi:hypothetical protein